MRSPSRLPGSATARRNAASMPASMTVRPPDRSDPFATGPEDLLVYIYTCLFNANPAIARDPIGEGDSACSG
jgi:hypothetical protein